MICITKQYLRNNTNVQKKKSFLCLKGWCLTWHASFASPSWSPYEAHTALAFLLSILWPLGLCLFRTKPAAHLPLYSLSWWSNLLSQLNYYHLGDDSSTSPAQTCHLSLRHFPLPAQRDARHLKLSKAPSNSHLQFSVPYLRNHHNHPSFAQDIKLRVIFAIFSFLIFSINLITNPWLFYPLSPCGTFPSPSHQ